MPRPREHLDPENLQREIVHLSSRVSLLLGVLRNPRPSPGNPSTALGIPVRGQNLEHQGQKFVVGVLVAGFLASSLISLGAVCLGVWIGVSFS